MTRPPCVRLCPAYPGNPRTRIEGESPPQEKGHTVFGASRLAMTDGDGYGAAVQALSSSGFTVPNFFTKATIDQISLSLTPAFSKLGMPVMLMPFLITQKIWPGRSSATSLRSGGSGCRPSENLAQLTP